LAYLAAERVLQVLPAPAEWQPVLARELGGAESVQARRREPEQTISFSGIERRAAQLGLQPLRWPEPFPFDSELAMRAATYAKSIGRVVPFVQAAFRQAFAGGRSLDNLDNVLIAGAACEIHPVALERNAGLRSVEEALHTRTARARCLGVSDVPVVLVGDEIFLGERELERAAARMRELERNDGPAQGSDRPAGKSDGPAQGSDRPAGKSDGPAQGSDRPAGRSDGPAQGATDQPAEATD
jgi:2-hydroxychromene-2-carboxylate isomerase